jgi:amidase
VVDEALPFTDYAAHHATYVQFLRGSASARLSDVLFNEAVRVSDERAAQATHYVLQTARAYAQRHRDWLRAAELRERLRRDWAAFFEQYDVVIAPASVSTAFPIDEAKPREQRTLRINGHDVDYNDQLFWAGLATLPSLPATAVPIGLIDGLPVGVQIIGPHLHDRTTLALAAELERFYPFMAPPAFR